MSRTAMKLLVAALFGTVLAWPTAAMAYYGYESAPPTPLHLEVLKSYIDPGVGGFIIVTVLGFISAAGYMARTYMARLKRAVFGRGNSDDSRDCENGEGRERQ